MRVCVCVFVYHIPGSMPDHYIQTLLRARRFLRARVRRRRRRRVRACIMVPPNSRGRCLLRSCVLLLLFFFFSSIIIYTTLFSFSFLTVRLNYRCEISYYLRTYVNIETRRTRHRRTYEEKITADGRVFRRVFDRVGPYRYYNTLLLSLRRERVLYDAVPTRPGPRGID